ncbi:MAG TPA: thiamine phosphate synthase [Pyrinomonadaceae bacterium]|nr:thiamine phosphate synthase [Pyrinomonadaceae bacterium]
MKITKPLIYLISDGTLTAQNYSENSKKLFCIIETAVETSIALIQIREKFLSPRLLFELTTQAVKIAKNSQTKILVNDRADIALAAKADGVHLTSNSIPTKIIRQTFPKDFIIGVSAHSFENVINAKDQGADFATFSPIFASPNKGKPIGLNALRDVCEKVKPFPILALGGIDETNYREVLQISDGFASIRFLNNSESLRKLSDENLFINCGT